jgi:CO/xanthine dehydrogenase Mo-binding subunit
VSDTKIYQSRHPRTWRDQVQEQPATYAMAAEMPEVDHIIVETIDPNGPFGAKEVGEGPIVCTMQAIANAVANALGNRIHEMPLSPWRVVKAAKDS